MLLASSRRRQRGTDAPASPTLLANVHGVCRHGAYRASLLFVGMPHGVAVGRGVSCELSTGLDRYAERRRARNRSAD